MPLFLSDAERKSLQGTERDALLSDLYWALNRRAEIRASKPGLMSPDDAVDWWRPVGEYLSDAAMAHALKPSPSLAAWLRDVCLSVARRPADDWVGPPYRNHGGGEGREIGHLETAHLSWGLAVALDLAPEVFTDAERDEIAAVLRDRAMPMCCRWLERPQTIANWRMVLISGIAVPAAVLNDRGMIDRAVAELKLGMHCFQPDGTYAESLQYGNYAVFATMLSHEALRRRDAKLADAAPVERYVGYARWAACSHLYMKPLTGWRGVRPRALNFNDSGAMFKPTADVLLHLSARAKDSHPTEAGLARWLFEETYGHDPRQGPHDQASFGLLNDFGFLALPLYSQAAARLSPADAKLPTLNAFSCGDTIARDAWDGRTVLGFHGGGDPLHGPGHLHGDLNSFILVHNRERLLADSGHSCYRNLIHALETGTTMHNTCTFTVGEEAMEGVPMEERVRPGKLEQGSHGVRRRPLADGSGPGPAIDRGGRRLIAAEDGPVRVLGGEAAKLYGQPIQRFSRLCILCGSHVVFVVDRIEAAVPVTTRWGWLLNNRDGALDLKPAGRDRIVVRRGDAGMKLFHLAGGNWVGESWAYIHDAYHCLPNHPGEGKPGSGVLVGWQEKQPAKARTAIHAIALDGYGPIADWHLREQDDGAITLAGKGGAPNWTLQASDDGAQITLRETTAGDAWRIAESDGAWSLTRS